MKKPKIAVYFYIKKILLLLFIEMSFMAVVLKTAAVKQTIKLHFV